MSLPKNRVSSRPSVRCESHADGIALRSGDFRPFPNCSRHSIDGQPSRILDLAGVGGLNSGSCPAAVARLVVPVVVNSVDRVPITGSLAHVREEVLEFVPSLADRDASPAVVVEIGIVGVAATRPHSHQSLPLDRLGTTVSAFRLGGTLPVEAPTALRVPVSESPSENDQAVPALACASPLRLSARAGAFSADHCESAKSPAGQIDQFHVNQSHSMPTRMFSSKQSRRPRAAQLAMNGQ